MTGKKYITVEDFDDNIFNTGAIVFVTPSLVKSSIVFSLRVEHHLREC